MGGWPEEAEANTFALRSKGLRNVFESDNDNDNQRYSHQPFTLVTAYNKDGQDAMAGVPIEHLSGFIWRWQEALQRPIASPFRRLKPAATSIRPAIVLVGYLRHPSSFGASQEPAGPERGGRGFGSGTRGHQREMFECGSR